MSDQSLKDTDVAEHADRVRADLTDIFDLVDLPIISVDPDCAMARFNRAAACMFHLTHADIGRSLGHIRTLTDPIKIQEYCRTVIAGGSPYRCEIRDHEKRFLLRIAAYPGDERPIRGAVLTFMNMTAFHASIEQAIHERQFTKAVLNTVTDPLVVLDADLRVLAANRAFFRMFQLTQEETHGSLFAELKHHRWDVPRLWERLKDALTGRNHLPPLELDHEFPTLGRRRILLTTHQLDGSGRNMILLTFQDITERKQAELTLRASEERLRQFAGTLEQRVKERTEELTTSYARLRALATDLTVAEQTERRRVATELHDYLAQLLVVARMKMSQLLKQDHEPEARKILQEADQLVLQSLDYTRSLVSELIPQALYENGLGAALLWLGDQMGRQQVLNVDVSLDAPERPLPEEDAVLLFHSIRELLFNVLKHGKTDHAAVEMRYTQNVLSITVSDQGCGFDVAVRDDRSDRFGLLSIRERMLALGGDFDLRSEPGKGTAATLILPLEEFHPRSRHSAPVFENSGIRSAPHAPNEKASSQNAIRVLLVDDHAMMREGIRSVLEAYSKVQIVGEARNGEEAIALMETLQPSLIVMDIHMPKLNGIDATMRIKSRHPTCKIIGLSANAEGHDQEAMKQAGADLVLTKEKATDELYQAILNTMAGHVPCEEGSATKT